MHKNLSRVTFPGRRPDEKVMLLLRRHWLILFRHGTVSLMLLFVPLIPAYIYTSIFNSSQDPLIMNFLILAYWVYAMFIWLYFFTGWIDYYLDAWIVTDDRIVNIEQNSLFSRVISEQKLYRIQDVTADVSGPIQTLFNFGTTYIQTAAAMQRFAFEQIPEPYQVKKIILQLHDQALSSEYARQASIEKNIDSGKITEDLGPYGEELFHIKGGRVDQAGNPNNSQEK